MTAQLLLERTIKLRTNEFTHLPQEPVYITVFIAKYVLGFFNHYFSYDAMDGGGGRAAPSQGEAPGFLDCDLRCCLYNQVCCVQNCCP